MINAPGKSNNTVNMKKTLIALMALAGAASAASELIYWGGNNGQDLLTIQNGYTPYLSTNGSNRAPGSIVDTLKTVGDVTYDLTFASKKDSNVRTPSFALNDAIYLNSLTVGSLNPTSFTINFGTAGSITTAQNINFGEAVTSFTLSASMTDEQLVDLEAGKVVTRTLMTGNANWGIWNFGDKGTKTFIVDNLDGYKYVGAVANADELQAGQFGYIYNDTGSIDSVDLVVKGLSIPEPTTATLSLLALAGLAARRRRR